ncbi:MAG: O-antigen ligase family protein [Actinobacteria bacterium]|nr:O-antigen ligase family protein [Actinomycetota bacterium]
MSTVASEATPRAPSGRVAPRHRVSFACYLVLLVVIASVIPWQSDSYFSGAFDIVAVLKAILALVGLLGALLLSGSSRDLHPVPFGPVMFVGAYLLCTVLGALAAGDLLASVVVAVRVGIQVMTIVVLAHRYPAASLLPSLVAAIGTIGALAAVTGLSDLAGGGRLSGGFPPMHPNELAFEAAVVLAWVAAKVTQGLDTIGHLAVGAAALGVLLATGSRTSLLVMVPTVAILMVTAVAIRIRTAVLVGALIPILVWAALGSDAVAQLISRGEDVDQLTTLSNRTIAWQAALAPKDTIWQTLFGSGLDTKQIPVAGQWWAFQILDSSWVSALVQGGLVGLGICLLWMLHAGVRVIQTSSRDLLGWQLAMIVLLTSRGLLESGLFDATTAFLVLICVTLGNGTTVRRWRPAWLNRPAPVARRTLGRPGGSARGEPQPALTTG